MTAACFFVFCLSLFTGDKESEDSCRTHEKVMHCNLRPTINQQPLRVVEQFSYMKIQPKLKFIQSDRCNEQCEFP